MSYQYQFKLKCPTLIFPPLNQRDNNLNINEFTALLKALFRNEKGKPYPIDAYMCNELFSIFNISGASPHV